MDESEFEPYEFQIQELERMLRGMSIVGTTETLVAGSFETGYLVDTSLLSGGELGVRPPPPPVPCTEGACCFSDGSCQDICQDACELRHGCFHGGGTTCGGTTCTTGDVCGACCHPDNSCDLVHNRVCVGIYMGDGTYCRGVDCTNANHFDWGACCLSGACEMSSGRQCAAKGGIFHRGRDCFMSNPCGAVGRSGACCNPPFPCSVVPFVDCTGTYFGDNSTCSGIDCANLGTGACCTPGGGCVEHVSSTTCSGMSGVFLGIGSVCAGSRCAACATASGGCTCCVTQCPWPGSAFGPTTAYECCIFSGGCAHEDCRTCKTYTDTFDGSCWCVDLVQAFCSWGDLNSSGCGPPSLPGGNCTHDPGGACTGP
jgi:hypothetical protein